MKSRFIAFSLLVLLSSSLFSQKNVRDSLKEFTISVVKESIKKGKIKTLAIWDFTDIHKLNSIPGSYISEQFSIYAEKVDSIHIMDRQNLKSILREHKLKSEGFIDKNTIMELGKFKEVDAVAVGSVIIVGKEFQVIVKIIETSFAETLSAGEEFFPIDKRMDIIFNTISTEKLEEIADSVKATVNTNMTKCYKCNGKGLILVQGLCNNCKGTGKLECSSCSGKGGQPCNSCHGSGIWPQSLSWGSGQRCSSCSGSGLSSVCRVCSGKKMLTCNICNGKKVADNEEVCKICNGKGQVEKKTSN